MSCSLRVTVPRKEPEHRASYGPVHVTQIEWRPAYFEYRCSACSRPMSKHTHRERDLIHAMAKVHAEAYHGWTR